MVVNRINELRDKVTFISGSSKNAGKTTFLNYLLNKIRGDMDFVFMTIGIDGEKKDEIFGNDKPVINTVKGDILLSSEAMMINSDASFEILEVFPWKTVLGKLLLLKTKRSGLIELIGPENNLQLERIILSINENLGIKSILIDGAVNRVTQISSASDSNFYYVLKVTKESLTSILDKMKIISLLDEQNIFSREQCIGNFHYIKGALTKNSLQNIPEDIDIIVVDDFTKVFLELADLKLLLQKYKLRFKNKVKLLSFVCNLYDIDDGDFLEIIKNSQIGDSIIFNPFKK